MTDISYIAGGGVRAGEGSNNNMSLWTWPWKPSNNRRLRLLRNTTNSRRPFFMTRTGCLLILSVFGLIAISRFLFWQGAYLIDINNNGNNNKNEQQQRASGQLSLAVLVSGSTQRFLFDSFVEHVIKPSSSSGIDVDYFAILTLKSGPAFRQDFGYMGHLAGRDTMFKDILKTTSDSKESVDVIQKRMIDAMTKATSTATNTNIRALRLLEEPIEDDPVLDAVRIREKKKFDDAQEQQKKNNNKKNKNNNNNSEFDLFQQFPMMDLRQNALTRTRAGNKNMIRLFLALESLWKKEFLDYENEKQQQQRTSTQQKSGKSKSSSKYDYVLILRDDTLWLADFDLEKVIATDPTADAYILSCDGRDPKMLAPEMNDHGILIRRSKADIVGEYVSAMASIDLKECHNSVTPWLGNNRGCNSEMLLKHILEVNDIKVKLVPQSLLPFERAVLIDNNNNNNNDDTDDYYCYHKFCQSIQEPLQLPSAIRKCKDLTF